MRRNMKISDLAAVAGLALAILAAPAFTAAARAEQAVAPPVPAPVPAQRPGVTTDPAADSSGWNAEVATSGGAIMLNDAQTAIVRKVNDYFNGLTDLTGSFVQTTLGDNKRMRGKFKVKRPGRFRFDYARPSRQIIISDGIYLAIQDLDLNNEDRVALDQTPFRLLLRKDVDLIRDANITEIQESDDQIILGMRDKSPDAPGKIRLFMSKGTGLALKEWVTTDSQGMDTRVEVSDLSTSEQLDAKLFKIEAVSLNKFHP